MQIQKLCDNIDAIMMSLPKTMESNGKMWNQTKYIVRKVLMRDVTFIEFEPLCQKLWAFMTSFTKGQSLNMVMSRDPVYKFGNFLFFAWVRLANAEKINL